MSFCMRINFCTCFMVGEDKNTKKVKKFKNIKKVKKEARCVDCCENVKNAQKYPRISARMTKKPCVYQ